MEGKVLEGILWLLWEQLRSDKPCQAMLAESVMAWWQVSEHIKYSHHHILAAEISSVLRVWANRGHTAVQSSNLWMIDSFLSWPCSKDQLMLTPPLSCKSGCILNYRNRSWIWEERRSRAKAEDTQLHYHWWRSWSDSLFSGSSLRTLKLNAFYHYPISYSCSEST